MIITGTEGWKPSGRDARPLTILLAASEVVGFAKTGGLADVAGALPVALARRGHRCAVIMPLYRGARAAKPAPEPTDRILLVQMGHRFMHGRLWRSSLGDGLVPVWLVEQDAYFNRDDKAAKAGIYQYTDDDGSLLDYDDNCERFVFFNRAVLEALPQLGPWPDVLHVNDWQTGLIPVYLREQYRQRTDPRLRIFYDRTRTLMTIHNIAFQGTYPPWAMPLAGLDWKLFNHRQLEYWGQLSFLKAGVVFSDVVSTVSPTYAREIQTPYYGCGLQGVLYEHRARLIGIVNGVDYASWDPRHDRHIATAYGPDDLTGKAACKAALQRESKLAAEAATPLLGVVARLTEQKGVDLIVAVAPRLLEQGCQLVILGEGSPAYHKQLRALRDRFPERMALTIGFNEPLAHRIEAGADLFLMPSAFEPSGLNQLYSLRYGTPPVVRSTGGLADTVTDTTDETLADGTATGFRFAAYNADALWEAVQRALGLLRTRPEVWRQVMRNGMQKDWSWDRSAAEYEVLFQRMVARDRVGW
ncbi:MAG: glycogen synthase GlgA [Gemmataceae bacterium]